MVSDFTHLGTIQSETKRTHSLGSFCHIKLQFGFFELLATSFLFCFSHLTNKIIDKLLAKINFFMILRASRLDEAQGIFEERTETYK